jgi:tetratricopeptide (TPR) repeat protein
MNIKGKLKETMGIDPVSTTPTPRYSDLDPITRSGLEAIDRLDSDGSDFWKDIRQELIEAGRQRERYGIFGKHNMEGQQFEKNKDVDNAIKQYEANVADERVNTISTFPHNRLMVIYHRMKDYDNEIRVIEKVLSLAPNIIGINVSEYQKRLQKAMALKSKTLTST